MIMRKRCPLCNNMIRIRRDGTMYKHNTVPNTGMVLRPVTDALKCSGSSLSVENARKIAEDRAEWAEQHAPAYGSFERF